VPGRGFRDMAGSAYSRAGGGREVAMVVPSFSAAAAGVASTGLVAPRAPALFGILRARLQPPGVAARRPPVPVTVEFSWHERTHADPASSGFRDLVRRATSGEA